MVPQGAPTAPANDWPHRLSGYDLCLAYWAATAERRALWRKAHKQNLTLDEKPTGIVIHSGSSGPGTAQWAWRPEAEYWAHFAWDERRGCYCQTDGLHSRAPHAGKLNGIAWGIETPHHPFSGPEHKVKTQTLVRRLVALGARWITAHKCVEPKKRDPGAIVTPDWWDGMDLRVYWEPIDMAELMRLEK